MEKNIVLIGFMGTGKTTIGKRLAKVLNREFFDTDEDIEHVNCLSIPQIFSKYGEIRFRSEEILAVTRAVSKLNRVIATGGGIVLQKPNTDTLKENGILILLKTKPQTIFDRIARKGNRPLLGKNITLEKITSILADRESIYNEAADFIIETDDYEYDQVVKNIIINLKLEKEAHYENLEG